MTNNIKTKKKPSVLTIIICILLSLVLLFGAIFGIINLVKYTSAVAYYGDSYIDEGEMNFLSSYYKSLFMGSLRLEGEVTPYDTPEFWEKSDKSGAKYGDRLKAGFKEYVTALLAAAALYDSALSFSGAESEKYYSICDSILEYRADGSVEKFNEATEQFGFTWDDFKEANILLYKSERAKEALFGKDGSNIVFESSMCNEYLETYTRVSLMFIRLENKFVLDEDGSFIYDNEGEVVTEPLSNAERAERDATIAKLLGYIEDKKMSPETFKIYQEKADGDKDMDITGYYLNERAEMTKSFKELFPEVYERTLEMKIGEYSMVECEAVGGVCFIYREAVAEGAYAKESNPFFSDFYSDAADYHFPRILKDLAADVKFKDSFDADAIISQPRNKDYYINSFD